MMLSYLSVVIPYLTTIGRSTLAGARMAPGLGPDDAPEHPLDDPLR